MQKTFYIIDNETDTVNKLDAIFKEFPEYFCVGISDTYDNAMNTILKYSPRLVFANIDIVLNKSSIFNFVDELHQCKELSSHFIAMSSFKENAYDTIKNNFFDFLLKPLSELELRKTLLRFQKRYTVELTSTLCLKTYQDYRFINTDEILYLKADDNAADLFMIDGKIVSGYNTLKHFEALLPNNFLRIHNSYIININHVTRVHFGKAKCTVRKTNQNVPFSRTYRDNVDFIKNTLLKGAILTLNYSKSPEQGRQL
jgi:DNA-binding LytR/AlgR family response regulator